MTLVPTQRRNVVDFTVGEVSELLQKEIRGAEITGTLRNNRVARTCNIIDSSIHSFIAESVDFTHCDFKDNAIRSCQFRDSAFGSSSWAYNTIIGSSFESCVFPDTDVQNCEVEGSLFLRCDLRNLLIKGCTFNRCTFQDCLTNNKVFETCRLTECSFHNTELQGQTIAENFGLKISDLKGTIRDNRLDRPHKRLSPEQLSDWIQNNATHPLQKLNVHFFLTETLINGASSLDTCLNLTCWLPMFRTAGSFASVLNRWAEFLLWLYENNQLPIHTLIRLHSMTDGLLMGLGERHSQQQALATISGTHLLLARPVERYLILLDQYLTSESHQVSLLVEGHQNKAYYYRALSPLFTRGPARITKLVKHNSPWDLGITFASSSSVIFFMGLFFATRTRIELSRIASKSERLMLPDVAISNASQKQNIRKKPGKRTANESILCLDFGGNHALRTNPSFRAKAYLPGNLVAELRLDVSSRQIGKFRKTLKDLL